MVSGSLARFAPAGIMNRYGGIVIHQSRDEHGTIEVVEDGAFRSLHFGSEPKQSSMELHDPLRLALTYTRAMTTALLFNDNPRSVLLIGLGGGSLAKFLLHHFPGCRVDAVEYREAVYKVARGYFRLPDDPRLTMHFADAGDFIRQAAPEYGNYDLILVDAFTAEGIARSTCGLSFFESCRARLAPQGVLAANLWSGDFIKLTDILQDISDNFEGRTLRLPVEGKANVIGLATQQGSPKKELRRLAERARALQMRTGVEFAVFLNQLRRENGRWWF